MRVFTRGGRRSIISSRGEVNVHRLIPRGTKLYLNWFYDAFASIIRLPYKKLFLYITITYVLTVGVDAVGLQLIDPHYVCASSVNSFSDYYFFVVQTLFTIGYGGKEPLCFDTNVGVTIISILGMIMHTALTGIVFTKFTLDNSRNVACAFSSRLLAIPPSSGDSADSREQHAGKARLRKAEDRPLLDEHLRLCFRFVDVFHRNYFHVRMRLFLVEHDTTQDGWSCPTVQELHFFDTSMPLEFMSLPVEVCAYIPLYKLAVITNIDADIGSSCCSGTEKEDELSPGRCRSHSDDNQHRPSGFYDKSSTLTLRERDWIRQFSPGFDNHSEMSKHQKLPPVPKSIKWPLHSATASVRGGPEDRCLRQMQSSTWNSSFELVCTIEFTDATTGNEINARKSWPLSDVTWLPAGTENSLCWAQIVKRMGDNGSYDVDVSNLDALTEDACELIKINRRELASDTRALGKQQDANSGVSTDAPDVDDERLRGSDTLSDWGIKFRSSDGSSDNIDVPVGNSRIFAGHDDDGIRTSQRRPASHESPVTSNTKKIIHSWRARWLELRSRLVDSVM